MDVTANIKYIGADDTLIDLFEAQYSVPNGVCYNSYVIMDKSIAVMDTVDKNVTKKWLFNLDKILDGRKVDYLIVSHMEPDHAFNIDTLIKKYPEICIVASAKTFDMILQFFDVTINNKIIVKEGDTLNLGEHTLQFFMAPMVHWPEVMVSYEQSQRILFSADAFGKFGALSAKQPWSDEARRYFVNIVGKYGSSVQALLKKARTLEINTICPLHGQILCENLPEYINLYDCWSSYTPEAEGTVITYGSIYGNTKDAAIKLKEILRERGEKNIVVYDLARCDMSYAISDAFKYDKLVVASVTYDGGMLPCVESFLLKLKSKAYQNRTVAIIENGTWAPTCAKQIRNVFESMKNISLCSNVVSLRSTLKNVEELHLLAQELLDK